MTYKGEAVVIGGFVPGAELTSGQSDRVFALRDGAWVPLPKLNHARAAPAAARAWLSFGSGTQAPSRRANTRSDWPDVSSAPGTNPPMTTASPL